MIFEQLWEPGKVPVDWKLSNVIQIFKKGKKDDPVSLNSVIFKIKVKILHRGIEKHLKNNSVIGHSQREFTMKALLVKHNFFFDRATHLIDQGKPVDVIF